MITKPLGNSYKKYLKDGRLVVDILVDLNDVLRGIDYLNDLMDERILGPDFGGSLEDINYQVTGHQPPPHGTYIGGKIVLTVNATVGAD